MNSTEVNLLYQYMKQVLGRAELKKGEYLDMINQEFPRNYNTTEVSRWLSSVRPNGTDMIK